MSRVTINASQTDAKSPINQTLMDSLRINDADHEARLLIQESNSTNWTSQLGTSLSATNLGSFSNGTILPDSSSVKTILDSIDRFLSGVRYNSSSIIDLGDIQGESTFQSVTFTVPSTAIHARIEMYGEFAVFNINPSSAVGRLYLDSTIVGTVTLDGSSDAGVYKSASYSAILWNISSGTHTLTWRMYDITSGVQSDRCRNRRAYITY